MHDLQNDGPHRTAEKCIIMHPNAAFCEVFSAPSSTRQSYSRPTLGACPCVAQKSTPVSETLLSSRKPRNLSISSDLGQRRESISSVGPLTSAWLHMIVRKFHQIASIMWSRRPSLIKRIERRKTDAGEGMDRLTCVSGGRMPEEGVQRYNSQSVIRSLPAGSTRRTFSHRRRRRRRVLTALIQLRMLNDCVVIATASAGDDAVLHRQSTTTEHAPIRCRAYHLA